MRCEQAINRYACAMLQEQLEYTNGNMVCLFRRELQQRRSICGCRMTFITLHRIRTPACRKPASNELLHMLCVAVLTIAATNEAWTATYRCHLG